MTDNHIEITESIIDHIHDVIFVIDKSFRIIYVNSEGRRIAKLLGIKRKKKAAVYRYYKFS